jgi:uncharacterized protein DUF4386
MTPMSTAASTETVAKPSPPDTTGKCVGRLVGVLLLLHLGAGLTAPFILLHPLIGAAGFLVTGVEAASQTRAAVFLLFVGAALTIAIAGAAWRVFSKRSSAMALWLFALAVAGFTLQAVDNAHILSMLSLSRDYAEAGPAKAESFQALALVVGAARKWSHYAALLTVGCWILLLFALLFRFRFVPRWLAALGVIGALMQIAGVSVPGLLGLAPETRLAMPLAPIYVLLAVWLMVRGFDERFS